MTSNDPSAVLHLMREVLEGLPRDFRQGTDILPEFDDVADSVMFSAPENVGVHMTLLDEALENVWPEATIDGETKARLRDLRALLPAGRP